MAERFYPRIDKLPEETNQEYCDRYAASIPAEALLREIVHHMKMLEKRRGPVWLQMGMLTGHGSGVSAAIVRRFDVLGDKSTNG